MVYYQVPKEKSQVKSGLNTLIAHELYTKTEIKKNKIDISLLKEIMISRKSTFFMFGCRFIKK